ncbi:hypothetical protein K3V75_14925, partial [Listeria monocytogenes]|nr:hypothetical protein [Listeria monocytogenes]
MKLEYDRVHTAYDEVSEQSAGLVSKRKLLQGELRQVRKHKEASDRFGVLKADLHYHTIQKILWWLYHIQ